MLIAGKLSYDATLVKWRRPHINDVCVFMLCSYYIGAFFTRASLGGTSLGNVPVVLLSLLLYFLTLRFFLQSAQHVLILTISLFVLCASLSLGIFRDGYNVSSVVADTSTFIRGPMLLIWVWALSERFARHQTLVKLLNFVWFLTTLSIIFSMITGIGLHTYEAFNLGWKFFFVENNELTFCYTLLTGYLALQSRPWSIILYVLVCVVVLLTIGTKAGLMGIAILLFVLSMRVVRLLNRTLGVSYLIFITLLGLFVLFLADPTILLTAILPIFSASAGFEKLVAKIEYAGLWEAVLSGRGRFVEFAFRKFLEGGMADIFVGIGFSDFKTQFGGYFSHDSYTEVDSVDVLVSYGVLGLLLYMALIGAMIQRWIYHFKRRTKLSEIYLFVLLIFTLVGNVSGHVVFSPWAMSTVAIMLGASANRSDAGMVFAQSEISNKPSKRVGVWS